MKQPSVIIILTLAMTLLGVGCTSLAPDPDSALFTSLDNLTEAALSPGERMQVVVTTSILGDVLANIVEDRADLQVLLPPGVDPHAYQPTPRDLTLISNADVVFINGLGLETFLVDALMNAGGRVAVVSLSEGVQARAVEAHDGVEDDHDIADAGFDAHVWLDPSNVATWVDNAELALSTLDPANASGYASSAKSYRASLAELDAWIIDHVAQIPETDRKLVTDHMAMGYFADQYGFEIVGAVVPAYSTAAEVSAQELAALQQAIEASGASAIFVAVGSNPVVSEQLALDLDLQFVQLYIGALSNPTGPAGTYLDLMHYNVNAIIEALQY